MAKVYQAASEWYRRFCRIFGTEIDQLSGVRAKERASRPWEFHHHKMQSQALILASELRVRQGSTWGVCPW